MGMSVSLTWVCPEREMGMSATLTWVCQQVRHGYVTRWKQRKKSLSLDIRSLFLYLVDFKGGMGGGVWWFI